MPHESHANQVDAGRPWWKRFWWDFARYAFRIGFYVLFRVRVTGRQNIPKVGPVVIASNHQSNLDPPLIGSMTPRRTNFVARKTLYEAKLFGLILGSLDAIPVDQEGSPMGGIRETIRRLKRGEMVVIFPEGARTLDGEMAPFQPGVGMLARHGNAMIVPAAIEGAFDIWPPLWDWPRFRWQRLHLHFGEPIPAEQVRRLSEAELLLEVERRTRAALSLLRDRREFADKPRLSPPASGADPGVPLV